jgi:hypothetical protein
MPPRTSSFLRLAAVLSVAATLAGTAASTPRPPAASLLEALSEKLADPRQRYDRPDEAARYFLSKRLPAGETRLPVERYRAALERMERMPLHSTVRGVMLPSRAELKERGLSALAAPDALGTWTSLGPGNVGGRTRALIIDPRAVRTMYAAGVAGGVWKTTNGGASWSPLADQMAHLSVSALVLDPADSKILYAGTGEGFSNFDAVRGGGIFKSTDAGATWKPLPATTSAGSGDAFSYVNKIVVSAADHRRVYAATAKGVWRSLDAGATWARALDPKTLSGCTDLALRKDKKDDVLFAACGVFEQGAVWRNPAAQGTAAWAKVLSDPGMGRTSLALAPSNQNVIYALAASFQPGPDGHYLYGLHALFRSTTGGAAGSWTARIRNTNHAKLGTLLLSNPVLASLVTCGFGSDDQYYGQGWYDNALAVDPVSPERVWAGGVDLFRSDDGGRSWGVASYWWVPGSTHSFAHADQHAIVFHPMYDGVHVKTLLVANDGGIFRTRDALAARAVTPNALCDSSASGFTWESLDHGYGVTQFYHGAVYPDGGSWLGGTQDNGTVRGSQASGPNAWKQVQGGDGGYVAIDPDDPDTLYTSFTGLSLQKSSDGGATFENATTGITEPPSDFLFITPFAMDPSDSRRLWIGGASLWRTTDGAGSWQAASARLAGDRPVVSALAVSPADPNRVLAGTTVGGVYRNLSALAADGSAVWPAAVPRSGFVSSIAFDPHGSQVAYATYSTFGGKHVWRTADGGATWSAIDGTGAAGLPDLPVHVLVVDPADSSRLYIGTDLGVFVSLDGGTSWAVENTGFANVVTEALTLQGSTLFAFTHGRGAWKVPVNP